MDLEKYSVADFCVFLKKHSLGFGYRLPLILEELGNLDFDLKAKNGRQAICYPFLERVLQHAMNHSSRLEAPCSYSSSQQLPLVGVADEGKTYLQEVDNPANVETLEEGRVFGNVIVARPISS